MIKSFGDTYVPALNAIYNSRMGNMLLKRPKYNKDGSPRGLTKLILKSREAIQSYHDKPEGWPSSFLRHYSTAAKDSELIYAKEQVYRECFNLIAAGQGSTTASIAATLFELGTDLGQEWQFRIRKELLRSSDGVSRSLNAVMKETLRIRPPFASTFPRDIAPGAENPIPGLETVPVGTTVGCNLYVMGHAKEIWGDDVDSWKPERWLEPTKSATEDKSSGSPGPNEDALTAEEKFLTFGKGPRSCVGREIALSVLGKVIKEVLLKWQIFSHGELCGSNYFEMQYETCNLEFRELSA